MILRAYQYSQQAFVAEVERGFFLGQFDLLSSANRLFRPPETLAKETITSLQTDATQAHMALGAMPPNGNRDAKRAWVMTYIAHALALVVAPTPVDIPTLQHKVHTLLDPDMSQEAAHARGVARADGVVQQLAQLGMLDKPFVLTLGPRALTSCLSPFAFDLGAPLKAWAQKHAPILPDESPSAWARRAGDHLCSAQLSLSKERAKAERTVGIFELFDGAPQSTSIVGEAVDLGRLDVGAIDPRLAGICAGAPHQAQWFVRLALDDDAWTQAVCTERLVATLGKDCCGCIVVQQCVTATGATPRLVQIDGIISYRGAFHLGPEAQVDAFDNVWVQTHPFVAGLAPKWAALQERVRALPTLKSQTIIDSMQWSKVATALPRHTSISYWVQNEKASGDLVDVLAQSPCVEEHSAIPSQKGLSKRLGQHARHIKRV